MDLLAAHQPPPVSVEAVQVTTQPVPIWIEAVGDLQAVAQVTLAPEIPGRILSIPFASGASVKQGDVILYLDDHIEQADLKKAKAQLLLAKVSLERAQNLASKNVESLANLDQKKADFNQAEAVVAFAEARLNQKKIRAPFEGDLGIFENKINLGYYINPGEPLVTLTKRDQLYVNFSLSEQIRPQLKVGQKVTLTTDAYPDTIHHGTLSSIDPQIKEQSRGIRLQANVNNKDLTLFPGMYAHVKISLDEPRQGLVVPETAVSYTLYGSSVFVIEKNEKGHDCVKRQSVQIGARLRNAVEIIDGLKEGDRIVSIGQSKLDNGALVTIQPATPLPSSTKLKA